MSMAGRHAGITDTQRTAARAAWYLLTAAERRVMRMAKVGQDLPPGYSAERRSLERLGFIRTHQDDTGRYWLSLSEIGREVLP